MFETNKNKDTTYQNHHKTKALLRENLMIELLEINNLTIQLMELEKWEETKLKINRRKK